LARPGPQPFNQVVGPDLVSHLALAFGLIVGIVPPQEEAA
jgi:hypothetical protein